MLTGLLLLPVLAILVWLYWYLLPGRQWLLRDSLVLLLLLAAAAAFLAWVERMDFDAGGPLWPYIVSAAGAYGILALGLGLALVWRRHE
jgi:hypothetical protein